VKVKTKVSIDDFPAGPRLDAEVARILGWTELRKMEHCDDWKGKPPDGPWYVIPRYSTDIGAAWNLVKVVLESPYDRFKIEVHWDEDTTETLFPTYMCQITDDEAWFCNTAPLAITRAFLKVGGVEEIEIEDE
jgi:hypothetical protein